MTTVTVTIVDKDDTVEFAGSLDNPNAINEAPTAALIIGSYLAANAEKVMKDAMVWFRQMSVEPQPEPAVQAQRQIILPGDDGIVGAPV